MDFESVVKRFPIVLLILAVLFFFMASLYPVYSPYFLRTSIILFVCSIVNFAIVFAMFKRK